MSAKSSLSVAQVAVNSTSSVRFLVNCDHHRNISKSKMFNNNNNNNFNLNKLVIHLLLVTTLYFMKLLLSSRPPAFPLSHPTAPTQNTYNFNVTGDESTSGTVMLFDGLPTNNNTSHNNNSVPLPSTSTSGSLFSRQPRVKRKSESDELMYELQIPFCSV